VTDEVNFGATVKVRMRFDVVSHGDLDIEASSSSDLVLGGRRSGSYADPLAFPEFVDTDCAL
jgi:hypothetical protein